MSANEPDYEAIAEAREEERGERWLQRMDKQYGRVEDYRLGPSGAAMSIAIGDHPEYGSAYRGGEGLAICGEGHVFGRCEQAGCAIDHLLICTAPRGHLGGDVPHVACGANYGVVGIWDGRGQVLGYLADNSDRRLANAGVTLR